MFTDAIVPKGLHVEVTRHRVRDGMSDEVDRWMAALNARRDECLATLGRDGLVLEIVFRSREGGEELLYWLEIREPAAVTDAEQLADEVRTDIDRTHLEFSRRVKVPGHEDLAPQLVLMPEAVAASMREWLVDR